MRELLKLKVDGEDVLVKYASGESDETMETVTLEAVEPPLPSLAAALQAMAEHLVAICEAPKSWVDEIEVRGVTLSHNDGVDGLTITGLRKLRRQNAPLVLNSPHATNAPHSESDETGMGMYSPDCSKAVERLTAEVWRYVDGERAQLALGLTMPDGVDGIEIAVDGKTIASVGRRGRAKASA